MIILSSTIRTLIGGITPIDEFFGTVSFSLLFTSGNGLVGRGVSVRSACGEGERGFGRGPDPAEMVLLFFLPTGEIGLVPPPLVDEEPPEGDLGEVVVLETGICGFSGGTEGEPFDMFWAGRDDDATDNRC